MATGVAQTNDLQGTVLQRYLIPEESVYVRRAMQKAADWSQQENPWIARIVSVFFAALAILLSGLNVLSYCLQAPIRILLNIAQFNPIGMLTNFIGDLTNVMRSLIFVSLGVTFITVGLLFPKPMFSCFAPNHIYTFEDLQLENDRLRKENDQQKKQILELQTENVKLTGQLEQVKK